MVFSKSYCPHCRRTKALLMEMEESIDVIGVDYVELDQLPGEDGSMVQRQLMEMTGQRTVPSVFIGKNHIGGNSDLQELHSVGKLESMLMELSSPSQSEL